MDEDAVFAFGNALAAIAGLLEEKGVCTATEISQSLGHAAMVHLKAGEEYHKRGHYLRAWAVSVKAAADGKSGPKRP
ncbi:hypothetical protein EDF56_10725 [Novosphingobium sp. PhB165]|uniref:hypothetical protein n=1 Tax=Novosphingobium sp. PhB165 TaxID=2485105 RepID=UPI001046DDFE|nr:hypothetical protein [Novosphingobium sp. PhB165]TCM16446.1 hypothetical protein EDF56_10725 [Novosphingobium sp. PhB165]